MKEFVLQVDVVMEDIYFLECCRKK